MAISTRSLQHLAKALADEAAAHDIAGCIAAGGASPGGSAGQVQFNDAGAFGGIPGTAGPDAVAIGMGSLAAGQHSLAIGLNCQATTDGSIALGSGCVAGDPPRACTISGTTVTIPGGDFRDWFFAEHLALVLSGLSGGTGAAMTYGSINGGAPGGGLAYSGGDTILTLVTPATSHTAGFANMRDNATRAYAQGSNCIASGSASSATGDSTTATAYAAVADGSNTAATGITSYAQGSLSVADLDYKYAFAAGMFSSPGDAQRGVVVLSVATTDATPARLLINGSSGFGVPLLIRANLAYGFIATITARKTDGSKLARFVRNGLISNLAGTTALSGSVGTLGTDINADGWAVALTADDTADALAVTVTGEAATTIHWCCSVVTEEVG